jgi:hypothetical protein
MRSPLRVERNLRRPAVHPFAADGCGAMKAAGDRSMEQIRCRQCGLRLSGQDRDRFSGAHVFARVINHGCSRRPAAAAFAPQASQDVAQLHASACFRQQLERYVGHSMARRRLAPDAKPAADKVLCLRV